MYTNLFVLKTDIKLTSIQALKNVMLIRHVKHGPPITRGLNDSALEFMNNSPNGVSSNAMRDFDDGQNQTAWNFDYDVYQVRQ